MAEIDNYIEVLKESCLVENEILINKSESEGYWSNLNKSENRELINEVLNSNPIDAIKKNIAYMPLELKKKLEEENITL